MASHDKIAQISLDCFKSLPKTGKPNDAEWTILSAIVKSQNGFYEVVALGTGSKCIGRSKMSASGDVLNDSHAEVACRRAFLAYLYGEMLKNNSTLLTFDDHKFVVDAGVEFHFFTTHAPCGDASIFPKSMQNDVGIALNNRERSFKNKKSDENNMPSEHITILPKYARDQRVSENVLDGEENKPNLTTHTYISERVDNLKVLKGEKMGTHDNKTCPQNNRFEGAKNDKGNEIYRRCSSVEYNEENAVATVVNEENATKSPNLSECGPVLKAGESEEGIAAETRIKRLCREGDIFRTGAKCLPDDVNKDPHGDGVNFHVIGAIRTKPGRGDRTQSVSCSDKLAKWCYLGIQGCLLGVLLKEPIYLKSFTIAGNTPFSEEALNRALFDRFPAVDLQEPYRRHTLQVEQAHLAFPFGKNDSKRPSPTSIIYTKSHEKKTEVAVEGRKQGMAKKNLGKKSSLLSVCKLSLLTKFLQVIRKYDLMKGVDLKQTYKDFKGINSVYNYNWSLIRTASFKIWMTKDVKLLEFCEN